MNLSSDTGFLQMILQASIVVKIVMGILVMASLMSWWYIFVKMFSISRTKKETDEFEREFWGGTDLVGLYQRANAGHYEPAGMEKIFEAGFKEYLKLKSRTGADVGALMDGTRRAMKATFQRELDYLESHLSFLATVGSVSPYIGLLGTVWGIMNAFRGLSNVAQATLAQVAPGIAEALIATAIGLFAAIPAVIAYNRYTAEIDRIANRYESFMEEFTNILQRQATH
ncbi:MAG: protein TolQ [Betaproteobacteria bacterium]|nr:protein TolQ [Betaproteobacteria bacterium]